MIRLFTFLQQKLVRPLAADSFLQPVAALLSGTTVAHLLGYLGRPALTRLFTAETFGLLTFYTALVSLLSTVASGRYGDALMLPETKEEAVNLLSLAAGLVAVFSLLAGVVIPWRVELSELFQQPDLAPWIALLPPGILAVGWLQLGELWYTRNNRFELISGIRLGRSAATVTTQIITGLIGLGAAGLVGGHLLGYLLTGLGIGAAILYQEREILSRVVQWSTIKENARRYSRFLRYSTPASLLNNITARLPVLLLLAFFSSETVGYFGLAYGTLAVPLGLLSGAVGQVFFIRAAEAHRADTLVPLTLQVHRRLIGMGLFPTLALMAAGPQLFVFVFGDAWITAGQYIQYLAPWIFLAAIASPLTRLFDVLERQKTDLMFSLVMSTVLTTVLITGGYLTTPLKVIFWFGLAGFVMRLLHITLLLHICGVPLRTVPHQFSRHLLTAVPFLLILLLLQHLSARPALLFGATLFSTAGYMLTVAWQEARYAALDEDPNRS